jgi:flagellin
MIGGLSSSLFMAQRTAAKARESMDTMARQIATGQKVASVKDNGAAWTRAAGMRSDSVTWQARKDVLDMVKVDMEVTHAHVLQQRELWLGLRELVLQARASAVGSQTRQNLQSEWVATVESMSLANGTTPNFSTATFTTNAWNSGIDLSASDSFLSGGGRWLLHPDLADLNYRLGNHPVNVNGFNLATATASQLDDVTSTINTILGDQSGGGTYINLRIEEGARDMRRADSLSDHAERMQDRLETARGSLTDADLSSASTELRKSETRQQLALSTIQQAISAYGNFAGGLLGNVQRTQRGLLA